MKRKPILCFYDLMCSRRIERVSLLLNRSQKTTEQAATIRELELIVKNSQEEIANGKEREQKLENNIGAQKDEICDLNDKINKCEDEISAQSKEARRQRREAEENATKAEEAHKADLNSLHAEHKAVSLIEHSREAEMSM